MPALIVEPRGPIVLVTIDRQAVRNALDPATLDALAATLEDAARDDTVGAVVLTGAGDVCFSAGMDLTALAADPSAAGPPVRRFQDAMTSPDRPPLVAAVRGMAAGGGVEIVLQCDLVVASAGARLLLPEVRNGIVPGGGALLLPARIPLAVAAEFVLLGDPMPVERARELGLVNAVVPDPDVLPAALAYAERLAALPLGAARRARHLLAVTATQGAAASTAQYAAGPRR